MRHDQRHDSNQVSNRESERCDSPEGESKLPADESKRAYDQENERELFDALLHCLIREGMSSSLPYSRGDVLFVALHARGCPRGDPLTVLILDSVSLTIGGRSFGRVGAGWNAGRFRNPVTANPASP